MSGGEGEGGKEGIIRVREKGERKERSLLILETVLRDTYGAEDGPFLIPTGSQQVKPVFVGMWDDQLSSLSHTTEEVD